MRLAECTTETTERDENSDSRGMSLHGFRFQL